MSSLWPVASECYVTRGFRQIYVPVAVYGAQPGRFGKTVLLLERTLVDCERILGNSAQHLPAGERQRIARTSPTMGAFVNLGDVTGLIHISQLSPRRIGHPTEVVNVDDSVMVTVLTVDLDAEQVSLKLKTADRTPAFVGRCPNRLQRARVRHGPQGTPRGSTASVHTDVLPT